MPDVIVPLSGDFVALVVKRFVPVGCFGRFVFGEGWDGFEDLGGGVVFDVEGVVVGGDEVHFGVDVGAGDSGDALGKEKNKF